jgi:hypothetical protein
VLENYCSVRTGTSTDDRTNRTGTEEQDRTEGWDGQKMNTATGHTVNNFPFMNSPKIFSQA